MTVIEFHHNAPDRTQAVCQLVAARVAAGERVWLYAPDGPRADLIDKALWSFDALSFVPHCREGSALCAQSPVVIGGRPAEVAGLDAMVNFSDSPPPDFERFERMIEVVGREAGDRDAARARFKLYRERGFTLNTFDLNEASSRG